jgi:succinate dehydrogenase (ubiquinone) cytochrome b560 subunit
VAIRVTGAALSGGLTLAAVLALGGADVASLASSLGSVPALGVIAKFTVAFPLVYHYMGALRHLYWDHNPDALETSKVR